MLSRSIPVKAFAGTVTSVTPLTHDIRLLEIELENPMKFWAGQYVDLTIPGHGVTRAYSMANAPSEPRRLQFIIKKYPDGAFSALLDGALDARHRHLRQRAIWRMLSPRRALRRHDPGRWRIGHVALVVDFERSSCKAARSRPVRFFYGARTRRISSCSMKSRRSAPSSRDFKFIPALSDAAPDDALDRGDRFRSRGRGTNARAEGLSGDMDAYSCGPPPMIDAVLPVLQAAGVEPTHIYFDKFTQPMK